MSSSYFNIKQGLEDLIPSNFTGGPHAYSSAPNIPGMQMGNMQGLNPFEQIMGGFRLGGKAYKNLFTGRLPSSGITELQEDINTRSVKKGHDYRGFKKKAEDDVPFFIPGADKKVPGGLPGSGSSSKDKGRGGLWTAEEQKGINKEYLEDLAKQSKDLEEFQFGIGEISKLADRASLGSMMSARAYENQANRSAQSNANLLNTLNLRLPSNMASFKYADTVRFV